MPEAELRLTQLLARAAAGDEDARHAALLAVHPRLQELAESQLRGDRRNATLHATALVNEAYLRLFANPSDGWGSRGQFYAVAAKAMRHIVVDHARRKAADKRGGRLAHVTLDAVASDAPLDASALLDLDNALAGLAEISPRQAQLVEMRFFAGLSVEDAARAMNISERSAQLDWRTARAWLRARLEGGAL
ncbi:MAG TPA: ECF-type sigma factor [Phycisphaerae bacterium]|mgnify:CR=1 FL=1|nr:ECF-type sigma factor [Phycisphaerae bacterium]HRW52404.1 ECF-type sigma factor [Phycisphaerae bacterium]